MSANMAGSGSFGGAPKLLKLLMLGNSTVGKTSLMHQFKEGSFQQQMASTIGVDYLFKTEVINGTPVKIQIWDTAGQERFKAITQRYYRMAAGIVLVYDVCDRNTFDQVETWMKGIEEHGQEGVQTVLVANKIDLVNDRVVTEDEGRLLASSHGMMHYQCSAKTGVGVSEAFMGLAEAALNISKGKDGSDPAVKVQGGGEPKKKGCCK